MMDKLNLLSEIWLKSRSVKLSKISSLIGGYFCYNEAMDVLKKAKSLNNRYIDKELENIEKTRTQTYQKKLEKYQEKMNKLASITGEPPTSLILLNPTTNQPLPLPPHHHKIITLDAKERMQELKTRVKRLNKAYKEVKIQNMIDDTTKTKQDASGANMKVKTITKTITKTKKRGRPPKAPSLRYYQEKLEQNQIEQKNSQTQIHQIEDSKHNIDANTNITTCTSIISGEVEESIQKLSQIQAHAQEYIPTTTSTTTSSIGDNSDSIEESQTRDRTKKVLQSRAAKKAKNQNISQIQKVSRNHPCYTSRGGVEKVAHITPVIYSTRSLQGKNASTLLAIFSTELTPDEIEFMLEYKDELELTHAELAALSVLANMQEQENRKQYWKIMDNLAKSKNVATPISKSTSTLLDEKLAQAQEAIFGEIIEKPLDTQKQIEVQQRHKRVLTSVK